MYYSVTLTKTLLHRQSSYGSWSHNNLPNPFDLFYTLLRSMQNIFPHVANPLSTFNTILFTSPPCFMPTMIKEPSELERKILIKGVNQNDNMKHIGMRQLGGLWRGVCSNAKPGSLFMNQVITHSFAQIQCIWHDNN